MDPPQARLQFALGDPGLVRKSGTEPDNLRGASVAPLPPSYTVWMFWKVGVSTVLLFDTLPTHLALNQSSSLFLGSTCLFFLLFCLRFVLLSFSFQFWDDQRVLFNLGLRRWSWFLFLSKLLGSKLFWSSKGIVEKKKVCLVALPKC